MPAPVIDAGPADELWRHTCFEVFLGEQGSTAYREFNFSPSGEWAAYAFTAYRSGMTPLQRIGPLQISCQRTREGLELVATLPAEALIASEGVMRIALSAVIEEQSGTITYWALKHPAGQPDFHHPESFVLEF